MTSPIVFGKPVTDETVRQVYPHVRTVTARERARVALMHINEDGKSAEVTRFVHELKKEYGDGTSTLGHIYNATGGDLTFLLSHTWEGKSFRFSYPHLVRNGQWTGFLHFRGRLAGPSKEAIVYRGTNNDGLTRDWMLAWNTTRMNLQNRVYTQIGGSDPADWNAVDNAMSRQLNNHTTVTQGCYCLASIGTGSSPGFTGIMSLDDIGEFVAKAYDEASIISKSLDSKYDDVVEGEHDDDDAGDNVVKPAPGPGPAPAPPKCAE